MQTIMEDGLWRVTCRINKADNLTLEIEHDGDPTPRSFSRSVASLIWAPRPGPGNSGRRAGNAWRTLNRDAQVPLRAARPRVITSLAFNDRYVSLPAETGPTLAPDRLSVWAMEADATAWTPPTTARRATNEPMHGDSAFRLRTSPRRSGRSWATTGRCDSGP